MRTRFWRAALLLVLGMGALAAAANAQVANNGCSDATLKGSYAFTITGQIQPPGFAVPVPQQGVAMAEYHGNGTFDQVDFVMMNGTPASYVPPDVRADGFRTKEAGTYSMNEDCTGTAQIKFASGQTINLKFVVGKHGRDIQEVVSGITGPTGAAVWAAIQSHGVKLEHRDDEKW